MLCVYGVCMLVRVSSLCVSVWCVYVGVDECSVC